MLTSAEREVAARAAQEYLPNWGDEWQDGNGHWSPEAAVGRARGFPKLCTAWGRAFKDVLETLGMGSEEYEALLDSSPAAVAARLRNGSNEQ